MITGSQRSRLAAIGVDVWVSRAAKTERQSTQKLWRDQTAFNAQALALNDLQVESAPDLPKQTVNDYIADYIDNQVPELKPEFARSETDTKLTSAMVSDKFDSQISNHILAEQQTLNTFTIEAVQLDHVVIITQTNALNEQEKTLWLNIQTALSGYYTELVWPPILQNFRDARGLKAYVNGFFDSIAHQKKLILLGHSDDFEINRALQVASLSEMIDQPLLKRRLWQLIQTTVT